MNVHGHLSSEKPVSSGVIQGSVLGPIFFAIYVNDIDQVIKNSVILKYADDVRIYRCFKADKFSQVQNGLLLQNDINALVEWSIKWELKFNLSKCCVLHFGRSNIKSKYKIHDNTLQKKILEKDLGVLFSVKLNFHEHIHSVVKKANRQLGIITRVFKDRNFDTIVPLYKTFVRPLLEYNSIIWSPYLKQHDQKIESVQMKMCKLLVRLSSLSYKEKLKKVKLLTLRARRIKHQLMTVYKIMNHDIDLCFDDYFQKSHFKKTRGNVFKLSIPKSRTNIYKNFFSCSIIKHWNSFKSSEILVRSPKLFNTNINKYFTRSKIL